jgi:sorting nexin-29
MLSPLSLLSPFFCSCHSKVVSRSLPKSFLNGSGLTTLDPDVTYWHFVKCYLNKHELDRYDVLKQVQSDVGKGRAWLRSSLNEHSLERYLGNMLEDAHQIRAQFYEDYALLRDERTNQQLIEIAKNLSGILFAINIDNSDLNQESRKKVLSTPSAKASEPLPIIMNRSGINDNGLSSSFDKSKPKARRMLRGNLITFQDLDDSTARTSSSFKDESYLDSHSAPNTPTLRNRLPNELSLGSSPNSNGTFQFPASCSMRIGPKSLTRCATDPSSNFPHFHDEERSDEELHIMQDQMPANVLLTPITTDNYSLVDSFAPAGEDDTEKLSCSSHTGGGGTGIDDQGSIEQDSLSFHLSQEQAQLEFDERLKQEIEVISKKVNNKLNRLESSNEHLQKENENLKVQLKNYIDAVQLLKPNGQQLVDQHAGNDSYQHSPSRSQFDGDDCRQSIGQTDAQPDSMSREQSPDFSNFEQSDGLNKKAYFRYRDALEYERKLIQVAEMHGELVEFNDRLHRILMQKDATIKRLKDELVELRGPVSFEEDLFFW